MLIETGRRCDRMALAAALFSALNNRYMEFEAHGFEAIRPVWERYSALDGQDASRSSMATLARPGRGQRDRFDGALMLDAGGADHGGSWQAT